MAAAGMGWQPGLFRLDPAGATTFSAMAVLHITDIHADPFYNVSWYGCGNKGCTRNLTLQDANGPTLNLCGASTELVDGDCGPFDGSHEDMALLWQKTIAPGPLCPCGVAYSNPPYSVLPPLRAALMEFADDGFSAHAAIYTGGLAGRYLPGTSAKLEHRGCKTAHAAMKATIDLLNVPDVEHLFVMGDNDVIPKDRPLTREWLEDLGSFLIDRGWLSGAEKATWDVGGFFWRRIHTSGLCTIGLNSNHWRPILVNHEMREAQLAWLPGILAREGETARRADSKAHSALESRSPEGETTTSPQPPPPTTPPHPLHPPSPHLHPPQAGCTSGFLLVSHVGVVCPGAKVHGGTVRNDPLWDATRASTQHCLEVRERLRP